MERRAHPDDPYRQPAASARADPALCAAGARRGGRSGRTRPARPAALRRVVDKQIEAGIDIGNNGEQQREAFFLYVRHRMSGFGGSWKRWPRGDVERYPIFKEQMTQALAAREAVGNYEPPNGDRRGALSRRPRVEGRMRRFPRRARREAGRLCRAVHDRAVARHHRRRDEERALRHRGRLSRRARRGAADRIRGDRRATASCCSSTAPISRSNGTCPTTTGRSPISSASSSGWSRRSTRAIVNIPRDRVRLHVCWGNYEGPHDRDVPLEEILPILQQGQGRRLRAAVRQSAACARIARAGRNIPLADDQIIVAGVIDDLTEFRRAPRGRRRPDRARRRSRRRPAARDGRHRLRLRHLGRHGPRHRGRRLGQAPGDGRRRPIATDRLF